MIRAALYERVSTEEQRLHGYSVETQIEALEDYCKINGYKIVAHYTDEGISGGKTSNKRPAMHRLLEDVKQDKVDIVLFTKIDRWFRNVPEYYKVQEVLESHHCNWKTIYEDYDTSTANGRFIVNVMLSIAEQERLRTSERINVVFKNKHKHGEYTSTSTKTPLGYKIVKEDGRRILIKDPSTREAYEAFFDTLKKTHNKSEARRTLLSYGIDLPLHTVSRFVNTGKFITGEFDGNPNFCEPYITKDEWNDLIERKVKKTQHGRVYLFTSLIRCCECGKVMTSGFQNQTRATGRTVEYHQYKCPSYRDGRCVNKSRPMEHLIEKQLLDNLDGFATLWIAEYEAKVAEQKKKPTVSVSALKEKLRRVNDAYFAGNLDDDEYKELSSSIKEQLSKAEESKPEPVKDLSYLHDLISSDYRTIYESFTPLEKQRFWRELLKEIELDKYTVTGLVFNL